MKQIHYDGKEHYIHIGYNFNYFTGQFEETKFVMRRWGNVLVEAQPRYGKCLDKNTIVMTEQGLIKMCDLKNKKAQYVLSLDKDSFETKFSRIQNVFERDFAGEFIMIKTKANHTLKLTPNHIVFVWDNGLKEKAAKELIDGDILVSPKIYSTGQEQICDDDIVKLMAYLISEGHTTEKRLEFTNSDEKILDEYKQILDKYAIEHKSYQSNNCETIAIYKQTFRNKLYSLMKITKVLSNEKEVPEQIFFFNSHQRAIFLNRLFSGDGSINKQSKTIEYCTTSKQLAQDVIYLLCSFGILGKLSIEDKCASNTILKRKIKTYRVWLSGTDMKLFFEQIGFFGEKEKQIYLVEKTIKNNLSDVLYNLDESLWKLRKIIKGGKRNIDRDMIKRWLNHKRNINRNNLLNLLEKYYIESVFLKKVINSDLIFLPIKKISRDEVKEKVYDIQVENDVCYFAGDFLPFLVHNSVLIKDLTIKISKFRKVVIFDYNKEWKYNVMKYNINAEYPDKLVNVRVLENFTFNLLTFNNEDDYASMGFEGLQANIVCDLINSSVKYHKGNIQLVTEMLSNLPMKKKEHIGFNNKYGTKLSDAINPSTITAINTKWNILSKYFWQGETDTRKIYDFGEELRKPGHLIIELGGGDENVGKFIARTYAGKVLQQMFKSFVEAKPVLVFEEARILFPTWDSSKFISLSSNSQIYNVVTLAPKLGVMCIFICQNAAQIYFPILENIHAKILGVVQMPGKSALYKVKLKYDPEKNIREFIYSDVTSTPNAPTYILFRPTPPCMSFNSDR